MKRRVSIVIVEHNGRAANRYLTGWLSGMGQRWRYASDEYNVDAKRNQAITRFLLQDVSRGATDLLMVNGDMVPLKSTVEIFLAPGDFIFCRAPDSSGRAKPSKEQCHFGIWRMSAAMLQCMQPPWFRLTYDVLNHVRIKCECQWFIERAAAVGYKPVEVGTVGHLASIVMIPDLSVKQGWRFLFQHEMERYYEQQCLLFAAKANAIKAQNEWTENQIASDGRDHAARSIKPGASTSRQSDGGKRRAGRGGRRT